MCLRPGQMLFPRKRGMKTRLKRDTRTNKEGVANLPWLTPSSFTEKLNLELNDSYRRYCRTPEVIAIEAFTGAHTMPSISFKYRWSRHRNIKVKGVPLSINHHPDSGAGTKGFFLHMNVRKFGRKRAPNIHMTFRLSRIRDCSIALPDFKRKK